MGCLSSVPEAPPNPEKVDLSHFNVFRVLGKGGYGKVHAVEHKATKGIMAMKRVYKDELVKSSQTEVVWLERRVMASVRSPFLVNLLYSFQTPIEIFLVMPFLSGGDLQYYLDTHGAVSEAVCRFYVCQLILGLQELHSLEFVLRDLKPANVLLDGEGNCRITDFGLVKVLRKSKHYLSHGFAGTKAYMAPEMHAHQPYGFGVDYWSLGICMYELLHQAVPFNSPQEITEMHLDKSRMAHGLSHDCRSLIQQLLRKDPKKRIGYRDFQEDPNARSEDGWADVKAHPWFASIDWDAVAAKTIKPPYVPESGIVHCSPGFEAEEIFFKDDKRDKEAVIPEEQQAFFKGFSFNTDPKEATRRSISQEDIKADWYSKAPPIRRISGLDFAESRHTRWGSSGKRHSGVASPDDVGLQRAEDVPEGHEEDGGQEAGPLEAEAKQPAPDVAVASAAAAVNADPEHGSAAIRPQTPEPHSAAPPDHDAGDGADGLKKSPSGISGITFMQATKQAPVTDQETATLPVRPSSRDGGEDEHDAVAKS